MLLTFISRTIANPPAVEDWHVPVALVDFDKLKDPNWDITATKVSTVLPKRKKCDYG